MQAAPQRLASPRLSSMAVKVSPRLASSKTKSCQAMPLREAARVALERPAGGFEGFEGRANGSFERP